MKKRIGLLTTVLIIALVICLLTWRFWPQSSSGLISIDKSAINGASAYSMIRTFENGQSYTDTYRIDRQEDPGDVQEELAEILETSRYQQDFRNLWPWGIDSVSGGRYYDGRTVTVTFYSSNAENQYAEIMFMSSGLVVVQTDKHPGMRIYHPTNKETLDKLVQYLQTNGIKERLSD